MNQLGVWVRRGPRKRLAQDQARKRAAEVAPLTKILRGFNSHPA